MKVSALSRLLLRLLAPASFFCSSRDHMASPSAPIRGALCGQVPHAQTHPWIWDGCSHGLCVVLGPGPTGILRSKVTPPLHPKGLLFCVGGNLCSHLEQVDSSHLGGETRCLKAASDTQPFLPEEGRSFLGVRGAQWQGSWGAKGNKKRRRAKNWLRNGERKDWKGRLGPVLRSAALGIKSKCLTLAF